MELSYRASAPMTTPHSVFRLRLAAVSLGLVLMTFWQSTGDTAADTKFDLVISPLRFLGRAVRLWDPITNAGVLQNQAYGYLFPIGPFFAGASGLGFPPWMMQRSWQSALLIAAFLGVVRLARLVGVVGFWPRVAAGLTYALAPRMLSELSAISSELMPVAALPWVLIPLVSGARAGSPRRAAARSGVAFIFAGAVNAGASLAILPLPALWLLTRQRGPRRAALMRWWLFAIGLASLWWMVPLLLLGRYSPPFLDWIETSSFTTQPTSLQAGLRGVDQWLSYLGSDVWPAGWIFASAPATIIATSAIAAVGLGGLASRALPHRTFWWIALFVGLALLTFGHASSVAPPWSAAARDLLDGPLAAFRNIHKFDPLVRLPIAIGLGWFVGNVRIPEEFPLIFPTEIAVPARRIAVCLVLAIGAVAVSPALTGHLVSNPRVTAEPGWWRSASSWLSTQEGGGRALVVPGSAAPAYLWGKTIDDALQPVARTPWTTRDAVPLAQAGYIRLLDEIEAELALGQASSTLVATLARAGIKYVVLRNDLNTFASASTPTVLVRATLTETPGFQEVAHFGPEVGGSTSDSNLLDAGMSVPRPSIEIFSVPLDLGRVSLSPITDVIGANGATDALPDLIERALPTGVAVLMGSDADGIVDPGSNFVLTDGIRRQQASFANLLTKNVTLADGEPYQGSRRVYDYLPDNAGALTQYRYLGITSVSASSSGSDPLALVNRDPQNGPWSALDGDHNTAWVSSSFTGAVGQFLKVTFDDAIDPGHVKLRFVSRLPSYPTKLELRTDHAISLVDVLPGDLEQTLTLPPGLTTTLTITVRAMSGAAAPTSVGIADLTIPGVDPRRVLDIPTAAAPKQIAFTTPAGARTGCLPTAGTVYCELAFVQHTQEDASLSRRFTLTGTRSYNLASRVVLRPGARLNALLDSTSSIRVTASSVYLDDPRIRPGAVVDGVPGTYWRAAQGDTRPWLKLTLGSRRQVSGIRLAFDPAMGAAKPVRLVVTAGSATWSGPLPSDGAIGFAHPVLTSMIRIEIPQSQLTTDTNSANAATTFLSLGVGEVAVLGSSYQAALPTSRTVTVPCGQGPRIDVDGRRFALSVRATIAQVLAQVPVQATVCGSETVQLSAGIHTVELKRNQIVTPHSITLTEPGFLLDPAMTSTARATIEQWHATSRKVRISGNSEGSLLVVRENFNAGWSATLNGRKLRAVRIDGWQQGWLVPARVSGAALLRFEPQQGFQWGLTGGAVAIVMLLVLAVRRFGGARGAAVSDGVGPRWLHAIGLIAGGSVLAGSAGLLIGLGVVLATQFVPRRIRSWAGLVGPALVLVSALVTVSGAHALIFSRANGSTAQLLCVTGLLMAAAAGSGDPRQDRAA